MPTKIHNRRKLDRRYDNNYLLHKHKHKHTINTVATEGKLMEPGLGTNPRSSGERCRLREPTRSWTTLDAGLPRAKRKRAKLEVSQWRPAGFGPVADATDPYRTSRICELQRRNGARACPSQCPPPSLPPRARGGGGKALSDRVTAGTEDTPLRCLFFPSPRTQASHMLTRLIVSLGA
jgi:hypothetical protein